MGAALVFNRTGGLVDSGVVGRMLDRLKHRGGDRVSIEAEGSMAVGARAFWTTPEELNESQPVESADGRYWLLFDGLVENRASLLDRVGAPANISDAQLLLRWFERFGVEGIKAIAGPLALLVIDRKAERVVAARDAQGRRTLTYHLGPTFLALASEEAAVVQHPSLSDELDADRIAAFLGLRPAHPGRTFFSAVRELEPGHVLVVERDRATLDRIFSEEPVPLTSHASPAEAASTFLSVLDSAVHSCLRATGPVAVSLSGGLDSSLIAVLAARAAKLGGPKVHLISAIFDELTSCDSRHHAQAVARAAGLEIDFVVADQCWPLADPETWPVEASSPVQNAFRRFQDRIWTRAKELGARVVLVGSAADGLYAGVDLWLRDRLFSEGPTSFAHGFLQHLERRGLRAFTGPTARRLIAPRGRRASPPPPRWLTAEAVSRLPGGRNTSPRHRAVRPAAHGIAFGETSWITDSATIPPAARIGVEIRDPFVDRRFVDFMLGLPPRYLYEPNLGEKSLSRRAAFTILPELVASADRHGTLEPLFLRMWEREQPTLRHLFPRASPLRRWVDPSWLDAAASTPPAREIEQVALWQCASLALWIEKRPWRA